MRRSRLQLGLRLAMVVGAASAQGCVTIRTTAALPVPLYLSAKEEFLLSQSAEPGAAHASQCAVRSAQVEIDSVRPDTLFVRRLVTVFQSHGVPKCSGVGAGYIVVSSNPSLTAQTANASFWRSVGFVVIVLPLVMLVGLMLPSYGGT